MSSGQVDTSRGLRIGGRTGSTIGALVWLTAVWVLLWGNLSVANVLGGLAVAALVRWGLPLPTVVPEGRVRLVPALRLGVVVAGQLVVSSVDIARMAVRPGVTPSRAVVAVQLRTESDLLLAAIALTVTLVPGSMVIEIDQQRRILYSHILNCDDDAGAAAHRDEVHRIEELFMKALPTRESDDVTVVAEEPR